VPPECSNERRWFVLGEPTGNEKFRFRGAILVLKVKEVISDLGIFDDAASHAGASSERAAEMTTCFGEVNSTSYLTPS
jgi:hypothetical protein